MEQIGRKCLNVFDRNPRRSEIGVDVAGEYVGRLDGAERLGITVEVRSGLLGGGEFCPDLAGKVDVGGFPGFRCGVEKDQIVEFGD
jgi:hypothetical protein